MPDDVIEQVHILADCQNAIPGLLIADKWGEAIADEIPEGEIDDDNSNSSHSEYDGYESDDSSFILADYTIDKGSYSTDGVYSLQSSDSSLSHDKDDSSWVSSLTESSYEDDHPSEFTLGSDDLSEATENLQNDASSTGTIEIKFKPGAAPDLATNTANKEEDTQSRLEEEMDARYGRRSGRHNL